MHQTKLENGVINCGNAVWYTKTVFDRLNNVFSTEFSVSHFRFFSFFFLFSVLYPFHLT